MDIHSVRQALKIKSIYDISLRVTYYARVSSESDEQLNSLGNQISYYEDLIKRNSNWTFVPGYIDEGLSGISTKKRENFNRMIDDARDDTFDLVITKEISRFARNTLDSIQYIRQLLSSGVGVFFQNDNTQCGTRQHLGIRAELCQSCQSFLIVNYYKFPWLLVGGRWCLHCCAHQSFHFVGFNFLVCVFTHTSAVENNIHNITPK